VFITCMLVIKVVVVPGSPFFALITQYPTGWSPPFTAGHCGACGSVGEAHCSFNVLQTDPSVLIRALLPFVSS